MPIDLVAGRVEQRILVRRVRGGDGGRGHYPDRGAFTAAGVAVAGVGQRTRGVAGMHAAAVLVGPGGAAGPQPLPVARAVTADDGKELVPVDRTDVVVPGLVVEAQVGVGHGEA